MALSERVVRAGPGEVGSLAPLGLRVRRGRTLARVGTRLIVAPGDGVVVRRYVEPGAALPPNSPLVALADDRTVRVEALGPSLEPLQPGSPVTVLDGMGAVRARLVSGEPPAAVISNRMAPSKGMGPAPKNTDSPPMFVLGQEVTLRCQVASRTATLCVPRAAVTGQTVFVVEQGRARRRAVETGLSNESQTEILSGLREGEVIVAVADPDLQDGSAVVPGGEGDYRQRLQPRAGGGH